MATTKKSSNGLTYRTYFLCATYLRHKYPREFQRIKAQAYKDCGVPMSNSRGDIKSLDSLKKAGLI